MATTAKRKAQVAKVEKMMKGSEVTLHPDTYKRDLIMALNYYNSNHDDKEKKKWLINHIAVEDKKSAVAFLKIDETEFRYAGILARMVDGGSVLQEKEELYLANEIKRLKNFIPKPVKVVEEVKPVTNVISIQDRMLEKAHEIAGEFDGAIDEFILNDKMFDAKDILKHLQVSGPVAKLVAPMFDSTIAELKEVLEGNDEQLVEGYSHMKKTKIKKYLALVESIPDACGLQVQVAKATRMPRQRKEKPAGVIVAKMKFMKEHVEYGIKSVLASTIVNSQELWVFNTKYKKLQVYRATDPKGLSVKGTTIIGYDPSNSGSRTLRKPELVKGYQGMGKRPLNSAYKALTTKEQAVNGRVNEECILLKVF
jgi:hypothetical protein